jgi:hypothetical protein
MKKISALIFCAAFLLAGLSGAAEQSANDLFLADVSGYGGWGVCSLHWLDGSPYIVGLDADSIPTCAEANVTYLFAGGPVAFGLRWDLFSAAYITGFGKDALGAQHDQGVFESDIDAIAAYTLVPWLFPYAFAGATVTDYSVFDPLHMNNGAEEFCLGIRAGAGVMFIPFAFDIGGGSALRIMAGPEVMAGLLFPQNLLYSYLRAHARVTVQVTYGS